jgi:hypothetical protein
MSPLGALVTGFTALILLGALAAWLVNVPLWAIAALVVAGAALGRVILRRISRKADRQKTET